MDFSISPTMHMKIIFILHFLLSTWGIQGYWSPDSYLFANGIFLITLIWSMHAKENAEPLQLAIAINLISILLDIIVLGVYFPSIIPASSEKFSAAMAIVNLVLRPVSTFVMSRNVSQRLGTDDNFSNLFGNTPTGSRSRYEDIDNAART